MTHCEEVVSKTWRKTRKDIDSGVGNETNLIEGEMKRQNFPIICCTR